MVPHSSHDKVLRLVIVFKRVIYPIVNNDAELVDQPIPLRVLLLDGLDVAHQSYHNVHQDQEQDDG